MRWPAAAGSRASENPLALAVGLEPGSKVVGRQLGQSGRLLVGDALDVAADIVIPHPRPIARTDWMHEDATGVIAA